MASFLKNLFASKKPENTNNAPAYPADFEALHQTVYSKVKPYTMTSAERIYGLIEAVKYITRYQIEGAIVECGVWKGGSMMAVAETLKAEKADTGNYISKIRLKGCLLQQKLIKISQVLMPQQG